MSTRLVALTPRLYYPYSGIPGAPTSRGSEQLVTLESGGQFSQPPEQPQTYPGEGEDMRMVAQQETRPINSGQLIAEVKGMLLMVEAKCPGVHAKQTACRDGYQPNLNNEQLQALIGLRNALLNGHHDPPLAWQCPSAGPSLRQLAPKCSAPARMRCRQRGKNSGRYSKSHNRKTNRGGWHCRG